MRDKNQFAYLARQVYPEDRNALYESYLDATRRPNDYLLLDPAQDTDDGFRFRTNMFLSDVTVVFAPVGDETDSVNYHFLQALIAPTAKGHHREFGQESGARQSRVGADRPERKL